MVESYKEFQEKCSNTLKSRIESNFQSCLGKALGGNSFFKGLFTLFQADATLQADETSQFLHEIRKSSDLTPLEKFGAVAGHYAQLRAEDPWKNKIAYSIFQSLGDGIPATVYSEIEKEAKAAYHDKAQAQAGKGNPLAEENNKDNTFQAGV